MHLLAIETTGGIGSVAVLTDGHRCSEMTLPDNRPSESLLGVIDQLLVANRLTLSDIALYACAIGPGSFTSLRIGLSTAKALAYVHKKPIIGISSLLVLAYGLHEKTGVMVPMIPARRGAVYATAGRFEGLEWKEMWPEGIYLVKEVDDFLSAQSDSFSVNSSLHPPSAKHLAALAYQKWSAGKADDLITLSPNYLQRPFAEQTL